ncbi:hypothetical protein COCNU_06G000090 [Cocos nucifera]|uniref:DUF4283 domain-containing protein n=1 Tax=Cocos nucifera TaxID=13894 RepID=A0A8K0N248_COCNU|nr:hypothetical protein COCNU_06G000090 [Cocos nucifera]
MSEKGKSKARVSSEPLLLERRRALQEQEEREKESSHGVPSVEEASREERVKNQREGEDQGPTGPRSGDTADLGRSWAQVLQGSRHFRWEMTRETAEDIAVLGERFTKVIAFSKEDASHAYSRLKSALLGRFLGKGFLLDFVQKKLKVRWNVAGGLQVSPLSEGILVFRFSSEGDKNRVLERGPWSFARQLLALEAWRPNFKPSCDGIQQARVLD